MELEYVRYCYRCLHAEREGGLLVTVTVPGTPDKAPRMTVCVEACSRVQPCI